MLRDREAGLVLGSILMCAVILVFTAYLVFPVLRIPPHHHHQIMKDSMS